MKRVWTKTKAEEYIRKVESGRAERGLKYLSAKDFLKNHKTLNKIISV